MFTSLLSFFRRNSGPAIAFTLLIFIACSWPGQNLPEAPVSGFDKGIHVGLFFGLALVWLWRYPHKISLITILGIGYGIFLELYQEVMPINRSFDWWDILADVTGSILGWALFMLIAPWLKNN